MTLGQTTTSITITLLVVAGIVISLGLLVRSCDEAREKYYQAYHACIVNGGSWIDRGEYNGDCIHHGK